MFEAYTQRALRAVFIARGVASQRGAASLTNEHLIEAIVMEDQGIVPRAFAYLPTVVPVPKPEHPFFWEPTAAEILGKLAQVPAEGNALPVTADMPVADPMKETLHTAQVLMAELNHTAVEPLHLLAAAMDDESCHAADVLHEAGVTRKAVLLALREGRSRWRF